VREIVDTQSLIWYVDQDHLLSVKAYAAIANPSVQLLISVATIWEIGIKVGLGKLYLFMPYRPWVEKAIRDLNASLLHITIDYCEVQSTLPRIHGDPFDRMIASQCRYENIPVVSSDPIFDQYGVTRIW
jgi:PIN domain nuclease of toxin-antitoxin system